MYLAQARRVGRLIGGDAHRTAELSLYVHKDFRGKGIGEGLLARLLEETSKQGERFHVIIGERSNIHHPNTQESVVWRADD